MAATFQQGDTVHVPTSVLPPTNGFSFEYSLYSTRVVQVKRPSGKGGNQIRVDLPADANGAPQVSCWIPVSKCTKHVGIAIVTIGDFLTEEMMLNPLSKSVLQYCRLLINDASVAAIKVRSIDELSKWASVNINAYSQLILIGHGDTTTIEFAVDGCIGVEALKTALHQPNYTRKVVLSLCCKTGDSSFASIFSRASYCGFLAAPQNTVGAAEASLFCQAFLAFNLLQAQTPGVAFKSALRSTPGNHGFTLWKNGFIQAR